MSKIKASKIIQAFLEKSAGYGTNVEEALKGRGRRFLIEPKAAPKPTEEAKSTGAFAKEGEPVWVMNDTGKWIQIPWTTKLKDEVAKAAGC